MTDDQVMQFLMAVAGYVAELHRAGKHAPAGKESNAGPRFEDDSIPWEEEGFSRWMGWRGEAEQEREIKQQRRRPGERES